MGAARPSNERIVSGGIRSRPSSDAIYQDILIMSRRVFREPEVCRGAFQSRNSAPYLGSKRPAKPIGSGGRLTSTGEEGYTLASASAIIYPDGRSAGRRFRFL